MVLVARALARNVNWQPSVRVVYSRPGGGDVQDRLEYVPIDVTISRLIARAARSASNRAATCRSSCASPIRATPTSRLSKPRSRRTSRPGARRPSPTFRFLSGGPGKPSVVTKFIAAASPDRSTASLRGTRPRTPSARRSRPPCGRRGRRAGTFDARAKAEFLLDRYIDDYAFHHFVRPAIERVLAAARMTRRVDAADRARRQFARSRTVWPLALDCWRKSFPVSRCGHDDHAALGSNLRNGDRRRPRARAPLERALAAHVLAATPRSAGTLP